MRLLILYSFCFTILFALTPQAEGQIFYPPVKDYTVKDGIPQSQVRNLYVDEDGMVWVATQSGVTLFDGRTFHTHLFQSLKEEYVTGIKKNDQTLILNGLKEATFWRDSIKHFHYSTDVNPEKYFYASGCSQSKVCWFLDDKSGERGGRAYISKNDTIFAVSELSADLGGVQYFAIIAHENTDTVILVDEDRRLIHFDVEHQKVFQIDSVLFNKTTRFSIKESSPVLINTEDSIGTHRIYKLTARSCHLIAFRQKGESYFHSVAPHDLNFIFFGYEGADFYIRHGDRFYPATTQNKMSVRHAITFSDKALIATDQGITEMYFNGLQVSPKEQWAYPWNVSIWEKDQFCISTYREGLHIVDQKGQLIHRIEYPALRNYLGEQEYLNKTPEALSNYLETPNWKLWGSWNGFLAYQKKSRRFEHKPLPALTEAFAYDARNRMLYAAAKNLYKYQDADLRLIDQKVIPAEIRLSAETTDLELDTNGHLWMSGRGGIARLNSWSEDPIIYTSDNGGLPFQGVISIELDPYGRLWVGGTDGIARWNGTQFEEIFPEWIFGNINQLLITPSGIAVAVSPQNIYLFEVDSNKIRPIRTYNTYSGYEPTEPNENGICYDSSSNMIWIPTVQNVIQLDLTEALKSSEQRPQIKIIGLNQKYREDQRLSECNIQGEFAELTIAIVDPLSRSWNHQYQLNGKPISPVFQQATFLVNGLRHGHNDLTLISQPTDASSAPLISKYRLTATLPLWERTGFLWSLAIAIAFLLLLIIWISWKQRTKDRRLKQLELELDFNRLRTLEAYFNPHFIFNTLTTIQDNILQRNRELGNELIVRLSRIFRYALRIDPKDMEPKQQNTTLHGVPLKQEIELVRDYIFLQQAQEKSHIRYVEELEPGILEERIYIPKLLIQPFVENIFKHAFPKNELEDQLKLCIQRKGDQLLIELTDNGWGSKAESKQQRASLGKKLALERMAILRSLSIPNNINIQHSETGTLIQIYIHYESYYHRRQPLRD